MSTEDTFTSQLNTWLSNNITAGFESTNVVVMRGNVLGTDYTTVFTYPGNQGKSNLTFSKIFGASDSSLGLDSEGYALTWGSNSYDQLGNGRDVNRSSPAIAAMGKLFSKLTTGPNNNFCLGIESSTGMLLGWGCNSYGQLGDGTTTSKNSPSRILGNISFSEITAWRYQCGAIEGSTGIVWSWGQNNFSAGGGGGLGDGTTDNKSSPVTVLGGRSYSKISTGTYVSSALEGSTGYAWSWGINAYSSAGGYLGDGTTNHKSSPVSVVGGKSFSDLFVEGDYNFTIEGSTGLVWSWGNNNTGSLGDGTVTHRSSPVSVLGGKSFCKISQAMGIEGSTGLAWAWGNNSFGELGDGSTYYGFSFPVSVLGGRSYKEITTSGSQSLAIEGSTGLAWAWGQNNTGKLGNNSTENRSSPVSVYSFI